MSREWIIITVLAFALAAAFLFWLLVAHANHRLMQERAALDRWLRGNLLLLRVHCSRVSPEAVCVINHLESALPTLGRIDGQQLEDVLYRLRIDHDGELLRAVGNARKEHAS